MEVALAEFDLTQLHDLKVGDVIEVPALMPGLDPDEVVVGMVKEKIAQGLVLRFTYCGVFLANYQLSFKDNTWNKV